MQKVAASVFALGALQGCGSDAGAKTTQVRGTGAEVVSVQQNVEWAYNNQESLKQKVKARARDVVNATQTNKLATQVLHTINKTNLSKENLQAASAQIHSAIKEMQHEVMNNAESVQSQAEPFKVKALDILDKYSQTDAVKKTFEENYNLLVADISPADIKKQAEDMLKGTEAFSVDQQHTMVGTLDSMLASWTHAVGKQPLSNHFVNSIVNQGAQTAHWMHDSLDKVAVKQVTGNVLAVEQDMYKNLNYDKYESKVLKGFGNGLTEKNVTKQFEVAQKKLQALLK